MPAKAVIVTSRWWALFCLRRRAHRKSVTVTDFDPFRIISE